MSSTEILEWVERSALAIELLAVVIIFVSILISTGIYIASLLAQGTDRYSSYETFRQRIGRALLAGLEMLVAADIIRTVALDATLESLLMLGVLVIIRTFLSWTLNLEVEGRWPWTPARPEAIRTEPVERP